MSSSSSSDCEYDDYCHYATGFYENYGNTVNRIPYYPTMGHPLIYYTQTSPYYQAQPVYKRRSRKRDPNCFVKAFRWYTQERVSNKNESRPKQQNEFASWLDMKYDEFLGNNPDQPNSYKLTLKQTSVLKTEKIVQNMCADTCTNNFKTKFKRLKSPWRRKCRARSNNESGDIVKDNQSCHYILQPKELSRPNSECCQSSIITVSTEYSKKTTGKSQSLTNLCQDRIKNEHIEVIHTQEGLQPKKDSMNKKESMLKSVPRIKSDFADVSCQCSVGKVNKIDAETQYEDVTRPCKGNAFSPSVSNQVIPTKSSQPLKVAHHAISPPKTRTVFCECGSNEAICQCVNMEPVTKKSSVHATTQYEPQGNEGICNNALYQAVQVPKPPPRKCPCEIEIEEFIVQVAPLKLSDIGAQTSDRCITFEKGSPFNYPLFMKIICADKLIEENLK